MAGVHALRLPAVPRHRPDRLLRSRWIAKRVRHLSGRVLPITAHIDDRVGVRGETQTQYVLPVILVVFCNLPSRESRPFGHPDVSPAFLIQCPCDAVVLFRRRQIRWERRAHHLFRRERFLRVRPRYHHQQNCRTQQRMTFHRSFPSLPKESHFIQKSDGQSAGCRTPAFSTEILGPSSGPEILSTCPVPKSLALRSLLFRALAVSIDKSAFRPKLSVPFTSVNCFPPSRRKSSRRMLLSCKRSETSPVGQRETPVCTAPSATLAFTSHPRNSTWFK